MSQVRSRDVTGSRDLSDQDSQIQNVIFCGGFNLKHPTLQTKHSQLTHQDHQDHQDRDHQDSGPGPPGPQTRLPSSCRNTFSFMKLQITETGSGRSPSLVLSRPQVVRYQSFGSKPRTRRNHRLSLSRTSVLVFNDSC